ncbi:hypothetical protein PCANC_27579 [Puccinia coronata f. sp. avenae]|uniref:Uncharacterized protein n=1 Tax=Puccinia coronata f. sp. avenae TaxID=200324 RepID=A0A2N5TLK0_9BASI|nr:hypothetical protein PCANC_27579 [Puccinia coronata f. sp. avenae]
MVSIGNVKYIARKTSDVAGRYGLVAPGVSDKLISNDITIPPDINGATSEVSLKSLVVRANPLLGVCKGVLRTPSL